MNNTTIAFVSPKFDFNTRMAIGRELINYIVKRAKGGRGAGNRPMGGPDGDNKYSKNYVKTPEFKAGGKTRGRVNITLTGDLLDDLIVIDTSVAGRIEIGAEGNDNKNKTKWLREKNYDFLSLSQNEVNKIISKFDKSQVPVANFTAGLANTLLRGILGN